MNELIENERKYFKTLTEDERKIYTADQIQLSAIDTWNDESVHQFVAVSRQLNELHRLHSRYNELLDLNYKMPNATEEQQKLFEHTNQVNEELFTMTMSIGDHATVFRLGCMDECDALYVYLAAVKMSRFEFMCDNFDIPVLIETLVSHDVYNR